MISAARDFIKARLLEENSAFKQWGDGFNRDNIPRTIFDKAYFIRLSNPSNNVTENGYIDDNIEAELELFFKGFRDPQEAIDKALDVAYNIKRRSSNPCHWDTTIKYVSIDSIVAEPIESNDNSIIIRLVYSFRLIAAVL